MKKVITDSEKIQKLLTKNVDEVIELEHLKSRLFNGERLRVKLGIDPTSPDIHIGRAVLLWKLREFQDLGHRAVFIVGDFTGQIGDTSDKKSERPMLSEQEVKKNMKTYIDQAHEILSGDNIETHYNSRWLKKLGFLEIGRMADRFGLHEITSRELIRERLDEGRRVSSREVLYPLMQGYDSVAVKADVELGGTDQRFNLLAGRGIQSLYGLPPQDIMMIKFPLPGLDGRKMSSSWGNVINITDEPDNMFGKVMRLKDELIIHYFEMVTWLPDTEISEIKKRLKKGENPRNIKARLAEELVRIYHGEEEAQKARDEWERVFSKGELPSEMEEVGKDRLVKIVERTTKGSSTSAKTLIDRGAVKINGEAKKEWNFVPSSGDVIQIGPRRFVKVK